MPSPVSGRSEAQRMPRLRNLITVVFFGDSITEGQYVAPPLRWVDIVSSGLQLRYRDPPLNLQLLPRGVSGETTRQALERFPRDVQGHAPDVVTLQFGLNDCHRLLTDDGLRRGAEVVRIDGWSVSHSRCHR